jgi:hypothetical protein
VGFSNDIISGFKHWYDVANTKLKSFVKGPMKILGGGSNDMGSRKDKSSINRNNENNYTADSG